MPHPTNGADFGLALIDSKLNLDRLRYANIGVRDYMAGHYGNSFIREEFNDDTINGNRWTVTGDTGTTSFAIAAAGSQVGVGGGITGSTATDDDEFISIKGHPIWKGDNNAGMLVSATITGTLTDLCLEFGFVDPLSDDTLPAINDIDTPTITNGAVTTAVIAMDTDQTLKTTKLVLDGDATYATSGVAPSVAWSPTTAVPFTAVIQTMGDYVTAAVFEAQVLKATFKTTAKAFEGGTYVQPWFIVGNRAASNAKTATIHRIWVWGDGTAL